jgi:hypothetical protein
VRILQFTVAAASAAALVSCTTSAADQGSDAPASSSPSALAASPVAVSDCWVPTSVGNISLSSAEARDLTTDAAARGNSERVAERLTTAVALAGDADPAAAREAADGLVGLPGKPRLVCSYPRASVEPQEPGPSGLVPRARRLRAAWTEVFGPLIAGGFASSGVTSGHVDGSAHYEGRAIDVFVRPVDEANRRRGWAIAQFLVANADRLEIGHVIFDAKIWTSGRSSESVWRPYTPPEGDSGDPATQAVLEHRDHVHVDVVGAG